MLKFAHFLCISVLLIYTNQLTFHIQYQREIYTNSTQFPAQVHAAQNAKHQLSALRENGLFVRACCELPCENGGVCEDTNSSWVCQCVGTGHYGERCHIPSWRHWIRKGLVGFNSQPSRRADSYSILPVIDLLRAAVLFIWPDWPNASTELRWSWSKPFRARLLPPVPDYCPSPLGSRGPRPLPSEEDVFQSVLARRPGSFVADHTGANLLLVAFTHHFLFQFLEAHPGAPGGALQVTARQVYGCTETASRLLRAGSGGRLRSRFVNNEEYPPCVEDAPVNMLYPANTGRARRLHYFSLTGSSKEMEPRWALGHPMLASTPLVFSMAVLWLREHNRVAGLLQAEHPHWDDARLYDTARAILTGEMVHIAVRELLPRLCGSRCGRQLPPPPLLAPLPLPAEFALAHFWGWQLPDVLEVGGEPYNLTDLMFSNQRVVLEHGLAELCASLVRQSAGKAGVQGSGRMVKGWTKRLMREARAARTQPFNKYRELVGLPAVRSFLELTGDREAAAELARIYMDTEAIELLTGLLVERPLVGAVLPPTLAALSIPYLTLAASSSPLGSISSWTLNTFGGNLGWEVVQQASLQNLVRNNLQAGSNECSASWTVPHLESMPDIGFSNSCRILLQNSDISAMLTCVMEEELRFVLKAAITL